MRHSRRLLTKKISVGDAAVDGLLAGVIAGVLMAAYLVLAELWRGAGPMATLSLFAPEGSPSALTGLLLHLAVAGVYGALFGAGWQLVPGRWREKRVAWLLGLVYGVILFSLAQAVLLPGTGSPLQAIPAVHLALAHLLYGLVLGWQMSRSDVVGGRS